MPSSPHTGLLYTLLGQGYPGNCECFSEQYSGHHLQWLCVHQPCPRRIKGIPPKQRLQGLLRLFPALLLRLFSPSRDPVVFHLLGLLCPVLVSVCVRACVCLALTK